MKSSFKILFFILCVSFIMSSNNDKQFFFDNEIKSDFRENSDKLKFLTHEQNKNRNTRNYSDVVDLIKNTVYNDENFKYSAYNRVAYLVDTFGPRLWGSQSLYDASVFMKNVLSEEGFENVNLEENKNSLHWVRGTEKLTLFSPRKIPTSIPMVGLGKSIGGDVKAELVVFESFEELEKNAEKIKDKIVLFNPKWTSYGDVSVYRANGPSRAAKYGAVACLVRSLSPYSIESPHGGAMNYDENLPKIPAAAISLEDADMFKRMVDRGQKVVMRLEMEAHFEQEVSTYNVVGEIRGSEFPNEIILMGGHIDSWDVGPQTGANDDAAGFMVCMEAVRILLKLGLKPKRTIRFIAWAGEEFGDRNSGAPQYAKLHSNELENHVIAFESDLGTTNIQGWGYSGGEKGFNIFKELNEKYLQSPLNMDKIIYGDGVMQDTTPLFKAGIPVVRNLIEDSEDSKYYFTYHHSAGDTISVLNRDDMDKNVIALASMFYIIADLPEKLPKE